MMEELETNQQKKVRFIEFRAQGYSLGRCAKELGVAKGTVCNWGHELAREIGRARAVEMEALMEQYGMLKEARIKFLATQLDSIRKELDERGLSDVPTAKILEMQLTYYKELMAEATETTLPEESEAGTKIGSSDKSVLCFMKGHYLEFEELGISESIGLSFHGLDFVVGAL